MDETIYLLDTTAEPVYTDESADGTDYLYCRFCGHQVVLNYDGAGTGWSHVYSMLSVNYLRSGMKSCA